MYSSLLKKKHRVLTAVMIFILMLSTIPSYSNTKNQKTDCVTLAERVIEYHYKNKDLGTNFDLSKVVMPELAIFLDAKTDIKQYSIKLNDNYVTNYNITTNLMQNKTVQDKTYLRFQVATSFNYIDLPDIDSGEGTIIEMLIDDKSNKIIDMYDPHNYFDNSIRGTDLDILNNSNRIGFSQIKAIKVKRAELFNAIYDEYVWERNTSSGSDSSVVPPSVITQATRYDLNKNNISSYARNNYYKQYPASGDGNVSYYDFSQIPRNWDCTNFVSHALLAGGATVYDTGGSGISSTGWYYRNLPNRSSSWSGVRNLYDFVTNNTTRGPGGFSNLYSTRPGDNRVGNIIQFHNGSVWIHSTVVTGTYIMDDRVGALVTGRSAYGSYNNNQKASDVYAGNAKRTLYLSNYN